MSNIAGLMNTITLKDICYFVVGIITVISVVVERLKSLPFKPWTHLFKFIGNTINSGVNSRLDKIEEQQKANNEAIIELEKTMENKFEEKQKDDDTKEAKRLRANIIQFADSCRVGNHHTQNHFENVFRDYDDYEDYCEKHEIPNHYIDSEYAYIRGVYEDCLKENKFI